MLNNQRGDTSPFAIGKSQSDLKKNMFLSSTNGPWLP
jgi:hypothetical protein